MENKKYIADLFSKYEDDMQHEIQTNDILKVHHELIDMTDEFNKELSEKQQQKLQDVLELEHSYGALESEQVFIFGFSLAIKLYTSGLLNDKC